MRPLTRRFARKGASARKFKRNIARTKAINIATAPMRGGIRL